VIKNMGI